MSNPEKFNSQEIVGSGLEGREIEPRWYFDAPSLIEEFEQSTEYHTALRRRIERLKAEHTTLASPALIRQTFRGTEGYITALHNFFRNEHKIPSDDDGLTHLQPEIQSALREYWNYIDFMNRQLATVRAAHYDDREQLLARATHLDRQRDKRHVAAALSLLQDGLPKIESEDEEDRSNEWPTIEEITIGRQLVSLMTEERGLDRADVQREAKKITKQIYNSQIRFE